MDLAITQARAELEFARTALLHNLSQTPEDRLNWSPSSTSRTPLQLVAHSAFGLVGIQLMLLEQPRLVGEFGKTQLDPHGWLPTVGGEIPYPFPDVPSLDRAFFAAEKEYTTRDSAVQFMEGACQQFISWMETLSSDQLDQVVTTHFGSFPVRLGITFGARHTLAHVAQLEYLQTVYGDWTRHM